MAVPTEFAPNQRKTEKLVAHVIWMTTGQGCDGDSVAMTSATNPSIEDIIHGIIPGMPQVVVHTPVLEIAAGPPDRTPKSGRVVCVNAATGLLSLDAVTVNPGGATST